MTRQEVTNKRDLQMSGWIRTNLPDSMTGTRVTDMDFVIFNINHNRILFLEVKSRGKYLAKWQREIYSQIVYAINLSGTLTANFACITFENTFFGDGKVWLDNKLSSEENIKKYLSNYA